MNNKGQVIFFTLMLGIVVLILAMGLAFPLMQMTQNTRNVTQNTNITYEVSNGSMGGYLVNGTIESLGMDCENSSISDFDRGACVVADMSLFYFIGGLIFLVGSILAARVLL